MKALIVAVTAFALLGLVGCTLPEPSGPPQASGGALPPPDETAAPSGEPSAAPAPETGEKGGVVVESIHPEPSTSGAPTTINIPPAAGWTQPGVPLTQQQADIQACYSYALAQINRESQIDNDQFDGGNRFDFEDQYGVKELTRRLDYYSERRRRGQLFDSCMESKGYVKD